MLSIILFIRICAHITHLEDGIQILRFQNQNRSKLPKITFF